jgi:hypothetical protein
MKTVTPDLAASLTWQHYILQVYRIVTAIPYTVDNLPSQVVFLDTKI